MPDDPWGNPYQYAPSASGTYPITLYSWGADGKPGGEGQDADLGHLPDGGAAATGNAGN